MYQIITVAFHLYPSTRGEVHIKAHLNYKYVPDHYCYFPSVPSTRGEVQIEALLNYRFVPDLYCYYSICNVFLREITIELMKKEWTGQRAKFFNWGLVCRRVSSFTIVVNVHKKAVQVMHNSVCWNTLLYASACPARESILHKCMSCSWKLIAQMHVQLVKAYYTNACPACESTLQHTLTAGGALQQLTSEECLRCASSFSFWDAFCDASRACI